MIRYGALLLHSYGIDGPFTDDTHGYCPRYVEQPEGTY
jgi:hypothetical protein